MQNVDAPGEDVRLQALEVPVMSKTLFWQKKRFSFDIILHSFQDLSRLEPLHAVYLK